MKNPYCVLFEQQGLIFETHCPDQWWCAGEGAFWRRLGSNAPDLNEVVVSLCFVLPPLTAEPGLYSVIHLTREHSQDGAGLRLEALYDARRAHFSLRAASSDPQEDPRSCLLENLLLEDLLLEDLPASRVAGRVLRLTVIAKKDSIHVQLESEDGELRVVAESARMPLEAWGTCASGAWQITSGEPREESRLAFPPGFGLCDVQVILYGDSRRGERFLPYSGALDPPSDARRRLEDELNRAAQDADCLACEMETWLRRTHRISESLELLAVLSPRLARSFQARVEEGGDVNPY